MIGIILAGTNSSRPQVLKKLSQVFTCATTCVHILVDQLCSYCLMLKMSGLCILFRELFGRPFFYVPLECSKPAFGN